MSRIVFSFAQARSLLDEGLSTMSLSASASEREQLVNYIALMTKWNPVYNLTAIRESDKMVSHHLLDSLVIIDAFKKWLVAKPAPTVLDVGTGGGLPGVVLAIMNPTWHITLIDPVHKKTAFLTQVKAQLGLNNISIITGKVENLSSNTLYDLITSRAFASLVDFVRLSEHVLAPDGFFAAMKGQLPQEEMNALNTIFANKWHLDSLELTVPQLDAQRHLIRVLRRNM